ncbi:DUF3592 domain-containing protein [Bradyrhizobium sp. AZCC 1721]|uniref:DUF3592 domain-containing protein n=1 Tax=Bradyrhizobium sp. AZCC 1721 TaxID=3117016 RepID=UPI002FF3A236
MEDPAVFLSRIAKFVLIPVGLLLLLGAGFSVWSTKTWIARAIETSGSVIEMVRLRDSEDKGYLFAPVVRFQTRDGRTIEFQSGLRSNPPAYRTGQTVSVLYDPDVPESAAIRGVFSLWLMPIIVAFIGAVFLIVATAMIVLIKRVSRAFDAPLHVIDVASPPRHGAGLKRSR